MRLKTGFMHKKQFCGGVCHHDDPADNKYHHGSDMTDTSTQYRGSGMDAVLPFQLESSGLRGRIVRLRGVLDRVLAPHAYPESIEALLCEALVTNVLLADMLKFEGVFSLQAKGEGPVSLIVTDQTSSGILRGYVSYDAQDLQKLEDRLEQRPTPRELLGNGFLAFTVDQGAHTSRYQGLVKIGGDNFADFVRHYFRQSEQLMTGLMVSVGRQEDGWTAAAISLQKMPEKTATAEGEQPVLPQEDENWRRAMMLMSSVSNQEMLDRELSSDEVLFRLFHEEGVRIYESHPIRFGCRCSRERVEGVLRTLSPEEIKEYAVDGKVSMTCEFCNHTYYFGEQEVTSLQEDGAVSSK